MARLKLTETARGVLKGETEVMLREQTSARRPRAGRSKSRRGDLDPCGSTARIGPAMPICSAPARVAFRGRAQARRSGLCRAARCHDRRHRGVAPGTLEALRDIPGIGDKKLEHYGDALIALVQAART